MWDNLFSSVNLLKKGLDATWLRNEVISNNIANVDTPKFKVSKVEFEDLMDSALNNDKSGLKLDVTDKGHISGTHGNVLDVEATVVTEDSTSRGLDGNNVDIETEMVALAKNSIEYYALVSKIKSEFNNLKTAINVT